MTFEIDTQQTAIESLGEGAACPSCGKDALGVSLSDLIDTYGYTGSDENTREFDIHRVPSDSTCLRFCYPKNCKYDYYLHP